jgi:hypothetical protein
LRPLAVPDGPMGRLAIRSESPLEIAPIVRVIEAGAARPGL